jgi:hypothetical protein
VLTFSRWSIWKIFKRRHSKEGKIDLTGLFIGSHMGLPTMPVNILFETHPMTNLE